MYDWKIFLISTTSDTLQHVSRTLSHILCLRHTLFFALAAITLYPDFDLYPFHTWDETSKLVAKASSLFDRSHESVESGTLERMNYHAIFTRFDMITPEVAGRLELRALF